MPRLSMMLALIPGLLVAMNIGPRGYTVVPNQPLNHSLYAKYAHRLVVVGHITAIDNGAPAPALIMVNGPPHSTIQFQVVSVVLGDTAHHDQILTVPINYFSWPEDLLLLAVGSRCALVLQDHLGEKRNETALLSVVPVGNETLSVARDNAGAVAILEGALVSQLKSEHRPQRQLALLRQIAPILTKEHSRAVIPFTKSKEATVARAALSALIYATEAKDWIREGARDVARFFAGLKPDAPDYAIQDLYVNSLLDPESRRWGHRWDEVEANKHHRLVAALFATGLLSEQAKHKIGSTAE